MCTRTHDRALSVVARSRASRDRFARILRRARSLDDFRAIPRPKPIVASPTRRRIRARRIRARRAMAWNPSVARVEARVERLRARDSRFATDRRVVLNAAGSHLVEARVAVATPRADD